MNHATAAAYLAAMIDGEGSVTDPAKPSRQVRIYNNDPELIDAIIRACDVIGIRWRKYEDRRGQFKVVIMGKENLERLLWQVPLQSRAKRARLEGLVAGYGRQRRDAYRARYVTTTTEA